MNEPADRHMEDASAALARIWTDDQLPDPERLDCFYRIAVEAGNLINDTMAKMRRGGMPEDEIARVLRTMAPPKQKRRRKQEVRA